MLYLIDTDIIMYSLKNENGVNQNFLDRKNDPKFISVVTYGELLYGAHKSRHFQKNLATVMRLADIYPILEVDRSVMESFALLKADVSKQGLPQDDLDLLIASTALSHNLTLVTNNQKHFSRIPDLKMENWVS